MKEENVKIEEREQSIGWLNMLADWIRQGQFDDDAALNIIDRAKTNISGLLDELSDAEEQVRQLREALDHASTLLHVGFIEHAIDTVDEALASTEPKEKA